MTTSSHRDILAKVAFFELARSRKEWLERLVDLGIDLGSYEPTYALWLSCTRIGLRDQLYSAIREMEQEFVKQVGDLL